MASIPLPLALSRSYVIRVEKTRKHYSVTACVRVSATEILLPSACRFAEDSFRFVLPVTSQHHLVQ